MDNRDKVLLQELLQESERKYRDTFSIESIVASDLESLVVKCVKNEEAGIEYVSRRLLYAMEEIKQAERAYLRAISICHSRIQDMQSVLER